MCFIWFYRSLLSNVSACRIVQLGSIFCGNFSWCAYKLIVHTRWQTHPGPREMYINVVSLPHGNVCDRMVPRRLSHIRTFLTFYIFAGTRIFYVVFSKSAYTSFSWLKFFIWKHHISPFSVSATDMTCSMYFIQ